MISISYDAEIFALQKYGGVSRYFSSLIEEFRVNRDHQVTASLTFSRSDNLYLSELVDKRVLKMKPKILPYIRPTSPKRALATFGPIRELGLTLSSEVKFSGRSSDIFHATYYRPTILERRKGKKLAITIHDFIPERLGWTGYRNPHIGKKRLASQADLIFCVSKSTATDLSEFYGINDERVKVVGHGVKEFARPDEKLSMAASRSILFLGHRNGYKNFSTLVEAVRILKNEINDLTLKIAGPSMKNEEKTELAKALSGVRIEHHEDVSDSKLRDLYLNSRIFCMTSKMEGFGIPILESLAVGTEVVAADIPVFREVGGKEVKFFDPSSAEDLANVLAQNLDSEITSSQIIKRITYAKAFSWSAVASQVAHHYRELLCQQ